MSGPRSCVFGPKLEEHEETCSSVDVSFWLLYFLQNLVHLKAFVMFWKDQRQAKNMQFKAGGGYSDMKFTDTLGVISKL